MPWLQTIRTEQIATVLFFDKFADSFFHVRRKEDRIQRTPRGYFIQQTAVTAIEAASYLI